MHTQDLINRAYLGRKNNSYNYDLYEMMKDFDFYEFCDEIKSINDYSREHGGMLVITDKQYILSYNSSFGLGTHMGAKARIYTDIHGGGIIRTQQEAFELSSRCTSQYLCARIEYECNGMDEDNRPKYFGQINFETRGSRKNKKISLGMFKNFEKFYNEYNHDIELTCKHFNFGVTYSYYNKKMENIMDYSYNLDNLYNYLKSIIDEDIQVDDYENIIGVTLSSKTLDRGL